MFKFSFTRLRRGLIALASLGLALLASDPAKAAVYTYAIPTGSASPGTLKIDTTKKTAVLDTPGKIYISFSSDDLAKFKNIQKGLAIALLPAKTQIWTYNSAGRRVKYQPGEGQLFSFTISKGAVTFVASSYMVGNVCIDGWSYSGTLKTPPANVPEPGNVALLGFGLIGLVLARRYRPMMALAPQPRHAFS